MADNPPNTLGFIKINDLEFPCYMENDTVSYDITTENLPFTPLTLNNNSIVTRMIQKISFSFNVYSLDQQRCIDNFQKLIKLLETIKPNYKIINNVYHPEPQNSSGLITLKYPGYKQLFYSSSESGIKIHLTSFSYQFNKELGFLLIKRMKLDKSAGTGKKYIPISYKISFDGKILLNDSGSDKEKSMSKTITNLKPPQY